DFPKGLDGSGQKIAIIELGGGYKTADLKTYFSRLGIKLPKVTAVSVDGAKNAPTGQADGPDGEVMLDIEVAGAAAPGAQILVYFPASSPHALACGGTHLEASNGAISREVVWNAGGGATGGGISDVFGPPSWQKSSKVPPSANPGGRHGRGVPDVSGDADPATG